MGTDLDTIVLLSLIIFGALEFALVIIPAMISRARVRSSYQPVYDVPVILTRPVPAGQKGQMRSWYFDEASPFRYDIPLNQDRAIPMNSGFPPGDPPDLPEPPYQPGPVPGKDWKAVNNANRAILRANKALLEANRAILEANAAVQQVSDDDLAWIDEVADLHQLRYPPR